MAKPIRGKKDPITGVTYYKSSGGTRKFICPRCSRGVAVLTRTREGRQVRKCNVCGSSFGSQKLQP
jgi:hypothetical protein